MANLTLYLQANEKELFNALSEKLREGWTTEEETLTSDERPEELTMRYQMARFEDNGLAEFAKGAATAKTPEEFQKAAAEFDFTTLSQEQIAELFFTLGTKIMSKMIEHLLSKVENDEDLEGLAGLTQIRHMLLETNASVPAP